MNLPSSAAAAQRHTSVLVVDDSPVQRAHAVQLCRTLGVDLVYEASDGHEALALLELLVLPPDLLLVDLHMPTMDGVEFITQLHQRDQHIPFLVASSQQAGLIHAVEEMSRDLKLPILGSLAKPLVPEQLAQALERFHAGAHLQSAHSGPRTLPPITARDLCAAIDARQLHVHYQPKVDMRTGIVRGMEVLARWTHPVLGRIGPDQFIALAEKEHLIHDLTLDVMRQALQQVGQWNAHGLRLGLAINLSPRLLGDANIVQEITALTSQHQVAPEQVVLEITESAGVEHLGAAIGVLARLRLKGFGLSIDDYGTGFSSMQQLARLPFSELKIDRSFVHGAHERRNLCIILQSALDMAQRLDLVSVAEGIETMDDWRLLQQYGCAVGQGYLIGRPMPGEEVLPWLRQHQARLPELRRPAGMAPAL